MKIIYLGNEIDHTIEHEIFSNSEFGFDIQITHTPESWYTNKKIIANNCTEFHWKYDDLSRNTNLGDQVAFESDIHGSGFTRKCNTIESVVIDLATVEHEEF